MAHMLDFHDCVAPGSITIVVCEQKSPTEWAVYAGARLEIPEDPEKPPRIKRVGAHHVGTYKPKKDQELDPLAWALAYATDEMPAFHMPTKEQQAEWKTLRVAEAALGPLLDPPKLQVGEYDVTTAAQPADADQGRWVIYKGAHLSITEEDRPQWILSVDGAEAVHDCCLKAFTPTDLKAKQKALARLVRQFSSKELPGFLLPDAADLAVWQMSYERAQSVKAPVRSSRAEEWESRYPRNYAMPEPATRAAADDEDEPATDPAPDLHGPIRLSDLAVPGTRSVSRDTNGTVVERCRLDMSQLRAFNLRAPYNPVKHRHQLLPKEVEAQLPAMRAQQHAEDPTVYVKFFCPDGAYTWFVTEWDPVEEVFFGYVDGDFPELGYVGLVELTEATGPAGLRIERDIYFKPKLLSEIKRAVERERGWHRDDVSPAASTQEVTNVG